MLIIVKFSNYDVKTEFIRAAKQMKLKDAEQIFCDEHLTQATKIILLATNKLKKGGHVKFAWVRDGK